eukprot:26764_6
MDSSLCCLGICVELLGQLAVFLEVLSRFVYVACTLVNMANICVGRRFIISVSKFQRYHQTALKEIKTLFKLLGFTQGMSQVAASFILVFGVSEFFRHAQVNAVVLNRLFKPTKTQK